MILGLPRPRTLLRENGKGFFANVHKNSCKLTKIEDSSCNNLHKVVKR